MSEFNRIEVLIVDDSATIRSVIAKYLGEDYTAHHASNGEEAWELIESNENIALIFADMRMPVMNGMMLLKQIRDSGNEHIAGLPVIMITGHEDSEAAKQASFNMGATDFISKPFSQVDIISRAKSYTQLSQKIAQLEQTVTHDILTGLFNEHGFEEIAEKAVAGSYRHNLELSIINLQVCDFQDIVSKHDKKIIDQIIVTIAKNLQSSLRKEEALAYYGNGCFSVLLPMTKVFKAHIVAMRFQMAISKLSFEFDDERLRVKIAIGLTSTEGNNSKVKLNDLHIQANQALEASLEHSNCKVIRYDELNLKDLEDDEAEASNITSIESAKTTKPESADLAVENRLSSIDINTYNSYMRDILEGNFENVPTSRLANMIKPLEAFLAYANEKVELDDDEIKTCD